MRRQRLSNERSAMEGKLGRAAHYIPGPREHIETEAKLYTNFIVSLIFLKRAIINHGQIIILRGGSGGVGGHFVVQRLCVKPTAINIRREIQSKISKHFFRFPQSQFIRNRILIQEWYGMVLILSFRLLRVFVVVSIC